MSSSTLLTTCECRWTNPLLTHYRSPHLRTSARPLKLMLMTHGSSYGCLCECGSDSNCLAIRMLNNVSFNFYPFKMQLEMNSGLGLNLGGCCSFLAERHCEPAWSSVHRWGWLRETTPLTSFKLTSACDEILRNKPKFLASFIINTSN